MTIRYVGIAAGCVALISAAVFAAASLTAPRQADAQAGGSEPSRLRVAVVDLGKVMAGSAIEQQFQREFKDWVEEDFRKKHDKLVKEFNATREDIKRIDAEMSSVDPRQREALMQDAALYEDQLKLLKEAQARYQSDLSSRFNAELIAAALIVVERVARREGYDLVYKRADLTGGMNLLQSAEAGGRFARNVDQAALLFSNDRNIKDITDDVKQYMKTQSYESLKPDIEKFLNKSPS